MPKSDLIARGVGATLLGQALRFMIQMTGLAVLARILTPVDYGQLAMIMSVVGIAGILGDFGLSLAAIQSKFLTDAERSNLFWLNSLIGLLTASVVSLCAIPISRFFDAEVLAPATIALSSIFLLNGIASQYRADLNRNQRYASLAATDVVSQLGGVCVGIVCAVSGLGFWALVFGQIAGSLGALITLLAYSRWVPRLPYRTLSLRRFIRFGAATSAAQFMSYISSNADSVSIGHALGSAQLGLYSRGFQLFMLPLQQIAAPMMRVALPVLSSLNDPRDHLRYLQRANLLISYTVVGLLLLLSSLAHPIVLLVLGAQWKEAATVLQILAVGGVFEVLGYIYYWAFLSKARMRVLLVCETLGRTVMIVLIIIAAQFGIRWVAAAYSAGIFAVWATTSAFGLPRLGIGLSSLTKISIRPLTLWLIAFTSIQMALRVPLLRTWPVSAQIGVGLGLTTLLCIASLICPGYRADVSIVVEFCRSVLPRQLKSKPQIQH